MGRLTRKGWTLRGCFIVGSGGWWQIHWGWGQLWSWPRGYPSPGRTREQFSQTPHSSKLEGLLQGQWGEMPRDQFLGWVGQGWCEHAAATGSAGAWDVVTSLSAPFWFHVLAPPCPLDVLVCFLDSLEPQGGKLGALVTPSLRNYPSVPVTVREPRAGGCHLLHHALQVTVLFYFHHIHFHGYHWNSASSASLHLQGWHKGPLLNKKCI